MRGLPQIADRRVARAGIVMAMRIAWLVLACSCGGTHAGAPGNDAAQPDASSSSCDPLPPTAADPIHLLPDGHWSPSGHAAVAQLLLKVLRD